MLGKAARRGLGEHDSAISDHVELPHLARDERHGVTRGRLDVGRETRSPRLVVSDAAVVNCDLHDASGLGALVRVLQEVGLDEVVDLSVEHALDVAGFVIGAQVFDQLIGLQHVGSDLVAPRDVGL